jgi:hypothetical protein
VYRIGSGMRHGAEHAPEPDAGALALVVCWTRARRSKMQERRQSKADHDAYEAGAEAFKPEQT